MGFLSGSVVSLIEKMPEPLIWQFAKRYIAGADLTAGLEVRAALYKNGMDNTMDVLGEDTIRIDQAETAYLQYCALIDGMASSGIPGNVSLKLTQFGVKIDRESAHRRVFDLARRAAAGDFFFRFDMEDSSMTDVTLDLFRMLRREIPQSGVVIQAYLKRSEQDVRNLLNEAPTNIRVCKGIYREPESIAWNNRQTIRENFINLLEIIFEGNGYPAIATHDPFLIRSALGIIAKRNIRSDRYEFQMLHGVGFQWRKILLDGGHRLRIYIPFGEAWRAYSFRRFRENPTLALYVIKNLLDRR